MNEPTHLDLCSGTGAFSIGFEREGFRTIGFSEIDPYCCALLNQNWPNTRNYGDIGNVPALSCTVISAGDPCQPFSIAGRMQGEADDRYLWPSVLAVVERCKPDFFLGENVVGIANMVLSKRFDDLEKLGYQPKAFDIPSCGVGLPTVERHIWTIAASMQVHSKRSAQEQIPNFSDISGQFSRSHSGVGERWDLPESRVYRSSKGVPNYRNRVEAIGNAVPPPIVQIFARAIRELVNPLNQNTP